MAAVALLVVRAVQDGQVLPRDRLPALGAHLPRHGVCALAAAEHVPVGLDVVGVDGLLALGAEQAADVPVLPERDDVVTLDDLLALGAEDVRLLDLVVALVTVDLPVHGEELGHGLLALGAHKALLVVQVPLHVEVRALELLAANGALQLGRLHGDADALLLL